MPLLSGAFGGLLATGLTKIPAWGVIHTWRNIFFFEGLISMLLGVAAFFLLPSSPSTATFLSDHERHIACTRLILEMKSATSEPMSSKYIRRAFTSPHVLLNALASVCTLLTINSMTLFVPSLLRAMGYSPLHSQLMSVPPYALATVVCIIVTYLSDRTRTRGLWLLALLPLTVVGFILNLTVSVTSLGVRYFALFLCLAGAFTGSPILIAWAVENSSGDSTRAIASGIIFSVGNCGGLIAAWTYTSDAAPRYMKGHAINLGFACFCMFLSGVTTVYLRWENGKRRRGERDGKLVGLSEEEILTLGHEHPEFRFTP